MKRQLSIALFMATALALNMGCVLERNDARSSNPEGENSGVHHNVLTDEEVADGWKLLFDGETTNGWRGYNKSSFPQAGWVVRDGLLVITDTDYEGGDLITEEMYENFILKLDWMIPEGNGNSGIFFHVLEQPDKEIYWSAPEIQIISPRSQGRNRAGALYDLVPADPQNDKPIGEWNEVKLVVDNPHIAVWQNGEKVVEIERWTQEWFDLVRESKFECHPEFGNLRKGQIGLQDHGDHVKFRNIKVKVLD